MKRRKDTNLNKVMSEGNWGEGVVTDIKERGGLFYVLVHCEDFPIRNMSSFESKGLQESELPRHIGIGSIAYVCMWDDDEYVIDFYDKNASNGCM